MAGRKNGKRNTKRKSRVSWQPFTGAILLFVVLALCYMSISDKNKELINEIRDQQRELDRLHKEYTREEARWNSMKSTERLETSMRDHGIEMNLPDPSRQVVRVNSDGIPFNGQTSVAYLRKLAAENVASSSSGR